MRGGFDRILIVKPSSLGDVIHSLPFLDVLRRGYPTSRIAWFVHENWAEVLHGHPDLDEVIPWSFQWRDLGALYRIFRHRRFDLAIDLQGLLRSGAIAYLSGAPSRIGFRNAREGASLFYTRKVSVPARPMHAVDRYLLIAEALGLDVRQARFRIPIQQGDEQAAESLLSARGLGAGDAFVVINAGARWRTKRWPIERFAQLAVRIRDKGMPVVLIGGKGDAAEAERMMGLAGASLISLVGQTGLRPLAAVLRRAQVMITNDSGPLHLAVAVGTPVIAIYGPTDPVRTGPYRSIQRDPGGNSSVIRRDLDCSPCLSRVCRVGDHGCMMGIDVDHVFDIVAKYVKV